MNKTFIILPGGKTVREKGTMEKPNEKDYEVIFGSREYIEDQQSAQYSPIRWSNIFRNNYLEKLGVYNNYASTLPTYPLISDKEYKEGQEIECEIGRQKVSASKTVQSSPGKYSSAVIPSTEYQDVAIPVDEQPEEGAAHLEQEEWKPGNIKNVTPESVAKMFKDLCKTTYGKHYGFTEEELEMIAREAIEVCRQNTYK